MWLCNLTELKLKTIHMKELIKKHFESKKDDKFFKSSVQYYIESGNVSGSFFMTLKGDDD